ncbi:MAG: MerR family transcriptional regulator [Thermodesulfobacteriota bacterium]|nr:MerR family transcriptional regulator [Thermodesulfobacteriota bacterium]
MERPEIPDKVYFKIGEASEILGVEPHVLRYWESEFPQIKPTRATSKQRLYRRRDLETFLEIKRLLYEEGFTIAGAKKRFRAKGKALGQKPSDDEKQALIQVKKGLTEIKRLLENR